MNRSVIYNKTSDYVKGRWINIVGIILLIGLVDFIVGAILGGSSLVSTVFTALKYADQPEIMFQLLLKAGSRGFVISIITGIISAILNAGFAIELMRAVKDGRTPSVSGVIDAIQKRLVAILVAAAITSVIMALINFIPLVGWIVSMVVGLALGFTYYIVGDDSSLDGIEAVKQSFEKTKGYKMDMFLVSLRYALRPLLGVLVMILGLFIGMALKSIGITMLSVFVGMIVIAVMTIYLMPFVSVANAVIYDESKGTTTAEVVE